MNDFTKNELKSLLWAIKYVYLRTTNCEDSMRKLSLKIQSMIGNDSDHDAIHKKLDECLHESNGKYHFSTEWGELPHLKCKKCGEIYK